MKMAAAMPAVKPARGPAGCGWEPGFPDHLTADTRRLDVAIVGAARCPRCRRRGMRAQPYRRGAAYRLIGQCPGCHATEEF